MTKNKPLLSILIATKNRQKYCLSAVESILSLPNENIEVVVQDNSDDRDLESMLSAFFSDKRLVYRYTPPPFSSIDNFNAVLELASGEYVCLIGDDDGINPEIIQAAQWAKQKAVDVLVGNVEANYRWEGTGAPDTFFTKMKGSVLTLTHFDGKANIINIGDSFDKLMKNGCTNYLDFDFPKLYHGIVKKEILDRIKNETGAYLKGLSPDIYSAIALSIFAKKMVKIDYPLTIPGVCGQSTSISEGQIKKHSKRLEDAPHFRDRGDYTWSKEVPRIYCVQTIWADSAFAALREFNKTEIISKFDKYMLCANIIAADASLKPLVMEYIEQNKGNNTLASELRKLRKANFKGPFKKFIQKRAIGRLKKILKLERYDIVENLHNMSVASSYLQSYLKKLNIDFIKELNKLKV